MRCASQCDGNPHQGLCVLSGLADFEVWLKKQKKGGGVGGLIEHVLFI